MRHAYTVRILLIDVEVRLERVRSGLERRLDEVVAVRVVADDVKRTRQERPHLNGRREIGCHPDGYRYGRRLGGRAGHASNVSRTSQTFGRREFGAGDSRSRSY